MAAIVTKGKKYDFLIGHWQTVEGVEVNSIRTLIAEGANVAIGIIDTDVTDEYPLSYENRYRLLFKEFRNEVHDGRIRIMKVPNIRRVGLINGD